MVFGLFLDFALTGSPRGFPVAMNGQTYGREDIVLQGIAWRRMARLRFPTTPFSPTATAPHLLRFAQRLRPITIGFAGTTHHTLTFVKVCPVVHPAGNDGFLSLSFVKVCFRFVKVWLGNALAIVGSAPVAAAPAPVSVRPVSVPSGSTSVPVVSSRSPRSAAAKNDKKRRSETPSKFLLQFCIQFFLIPRKKICPSI